MPSLRSRLFLLLLQHRHLLRLKLKRQTFFDWDTSIEEFRQGVDKSSTLFGKMPEGIDVSPISIDGIPAEWIIPSDSSKDRVILYFHGGGYVSGTCKAHRMHVAKVVKASGIPSLLFEYRLAPEHPFPAAVEDSLAAYHYLLAEGVSPSHIAFMGDSAGGGLCLATLLALKDQKIPLPAAAVALSPWTDLKCSGQSYTTKLDVEPLAPTESWTVFSHYYVQEQDPCHPWISPLYGNLEGLPPLRIFVGEYETLHDDSTCFAEKAKEAGVDVTLTVGEKMFHCYPVCAPIFPEATQAMREICAFIRTHISNQQSDHNDRSGS